VHCDQGTARVKGLCDELPITVVELRTGADEPRSPGLPITSRMLPGKDTPTAARSIAGAALLLSNTR